jgi:hypothetical protein
MEKLTSTIINGRPEFHVGMKVRYISNRICLMGKGVPSKNLNGEIGDVLEIHSGYESSAGHRQYGEEHDFAGWFLVKFPFSPYTNSMPMALCFDDEGKKWEIVA